MTSAVDSTATGAGGILRFPNPGSELERVVNHFRVIYRAAQLREAPAAPFDHFFAIEALVRDNRVSSKGAIGEEALVRGAEADLSRHRTYNQLKMYTELYRMLGLLRTTSRRSEFVVTPLGEQLCDTGRDDFTGWDPKSPLDRQERGLIRECLIGICIPNPTTRQLGIEHLRPFRQLLRLMHRLDGVMTRDEMLISLYKISDDRDDSAIDAAVERVRAVRGDRAALGRAFDAARGQLGAETVRNYTRFPLGVLKSKILDWATPTRRSGLYGVKPIHAYELTEVGLAAAVALETVRDVRETDLEGLPLEARAAFANCAFYSTLTRAGYDVSAYASYIAAFRDRARPALDALHIEHTDDVIYSALQQAPDSVLAECERLFEEIS